MMAQRGPSCHLGSALNIKGEHCIYRPSLEEVSECSSRVVPAWCRMREQEYVGEDTADDGSPRYVVKRLG